jgi:3-hydroxyisobutyrate dehydrogenase
MADKKNVGYIGLGNIGKPSTEHLIREAFNVHVFDVYQPAIDELVEKGAIGCASVAELAAKCEYIGICVRDEAQVDELRYGDAGILANAVADTIIAIHSTVSRAAVIRWADDARVKHC